MIRYETIDENQIKDIMGGQAPRPPADWDEPSEPGEPPKAEAESGDGKPSVITSYSIHYTKLYDVIYAILMLLNALPVALAGEGEVAGVLGVVAQGGAFIDGSAILALRFAVVMSLNLAILNLLPIPPLDA